MARVLEETGCSIISSDLYNRGYGKSGVDFLEAQDEVDNVVTNPPYNCAEQFVQTALRITKPQLVAAGTILALVLRRG